MHSLLIKNMCNSDNLCHHLLSQSVKIKKQIKDITRWGEDMNFIFEWQNIRVLKQPGRVCGRRREKTSEVWVENVVQSGNIIYEI